MISFIVCTERESNKAQESIRYLGCGYEYLPQRAAPGIASAYNTGSERAKGDILVFLHDDVSILGNRIALEMLERQLDTPKCGFIGVTGTRQLDKHGCWWDTSERKSVRGGILHASPDSMAKWAGPESLPYYLSSWPQTGAAYFGRCVVLDGVFLAVSKVIFEDVGGFDVLTFPGFDMYDIDITLRSHMKGYKNWTIPFPLMHHTTRPIGESYNKARVKFCEKYRDILPVIC